MRTGAFAAILVSFLIADTYASQLVFAAPAINDRRASNSIDHFQLVEDTCWWWGTRWQYGWRGYGWYPCWDWTKPQPTVIAPDEVPADAATKQSCVQSVRDPSGNVRSRRVC
jgi:hypothetical protein